MVCFIAHNPSLDDLLKGLSIENGHLFVEQDKNDMFNQSKVILEKETPMTDDDIESILEAYKRSYINSLKPTKLKSVENIGKIFSNNISYESLIDQDDNSQIIASLQSKGCLVHIPTEGNKLSWDSLAGYEKMKRTIEDSVLFTLTHPDIFKEITSNTRAVAEINKPK